MSCSTSAKNDVAIPAIDRAVFIVCEGNYGSGNATLSVLDTLTTDTTYNNVFASVNGRSLGDHAHSMIVVDSTGYIAVTHSDKIEVINTRTFESAAPPIETVSSPRDLASYNGQLYVTSYLDSSVAVLDAGYAVVTRIKLQHRPDEIRILNAKAYVSNAFNLQNAVGNDSTISIIDLNSNTVLSNLFVGKNPVSLAADPVRNRMIVACAGNTDFYGSVVGVDAASDQVTSVIDTSGIFPTKIALRDSLLAYIVMDTKGIRVINLNSGVVTAVDGNYYSVAFGNGELFATDAQDFISDGNVIWFGSDLTRRKTLPVGISPSAIVFSQ